MAEMAVSASCANRHKMTSKRLRKKGRIQDDNAGPVERRTRPSAIPRVVRHALSLAVLPDLIFVSSTPPALLSQLIQPVQHGR